MQVLFAKVKKNKLGSVQTEDTIDRSRSQLTRRPATSSSRAIYRSFVTKDSGKA